MPDLPPPAGDPGADPEPELHELELHEPAHRAAGRRAVRTWMRGHENGCFTNLHPVERWPAAGFGGEALDDARAEALARRSGDDRGKRPSVS